MPVTVLTGLLSLILPLCAGIGLTIVLPALALSALNQAGTTPEELRDILADSVSTPRGLALKLIDVPGERLPGSEGQVTQDFVMQNAPAFTAPDPKTFLKTLKLLAKTTDRGEGLKKVASAVLRPMPLPAPVTRATPVCEASVW